MRLIAAVVAVLVGLPAMAQTACPALGPSGAGSYDDVRITWTRPASWAEGGTIPSAATFSYTVYRQSGTSWVELCRTSTLGTTLATQPSGAQVYRVTARTPSSIPANVESAPTNSASVTVPSPLTPSAPGNFSVTVNVTVTVNP